MLVVKYSIRHVIISAVLQEDRAGGRARAGKEIAAEEGRRRQRVRVGQVGPPSERGVNKNSAIEDASCEFENRM